jgi:hypothetical protein
MGAGSGVSIELSEGQLREVLRSALREDLLSRLGSLELSRAVLLRAVGRGLLADGAGGEVSYTLVRGLLVLSAFAVGGPTRGVTEVAKELAMKTSTVHRAIRTLAALGLLQHDEASRQYRRTLEISRQAG